MVGLETSGSLDGVGVSTLAQHARDVGSIHTLGAVIPSFINRTTLAAIMQAIWCMVVEPTQCKHIVCTCIACMHELDGIAEWVEIHLPIECTSSNTGRVKQMT